MATEERSPFGEMHSSLMAIKRAKEEIAGQARMAVSLLDHLSKSGSELEGDEVKRLAKIALKYVENIRTEVGL